MCVGNAQGFIGYSMNGRLIQVSGQLQYLFPSDGGHITVENINYIKGMVWTISNTFLLFLWPCFCRTQFKAIVTRSRSPLDNSSHAHSGFSDVFITGSSLVKVALRKDGHCIYTHISKTLNRPSSQPIRCKEKYEGKINQWVTISCKFSSSNHTIFVFSFPYHYIT